MALLISMRLLYGLKAIYHAISDSNVFSIFFTLETRCGVFHAVICKCHLLLAFQIY